MVKSDHALGRSRGRWTTKIHALTDELCAPVTMLLSPGQAEDNPMLAPLLDAHPDRFTGDTRLLGDKAYSHNSTRADLRKRKIKHTIPERSNPNLLPQEQRLRRRGTEQPSAPSSIATATPSNAASTGSSNGAASPHATTSTP